MNNVYQMIENLRKTKDRIILSIDGRCGAGKSTLANELTEKYNATLFHMDDFFLPEIMKTKERLSIPGANIHHERMIKEIFSQLNKEKLVYQSFDCSTQDLNHPKEIILSNVIIIEGVYSQKDVLRQYYDLNIFMTTDEETQKERLKKRNPKLYNRFIFEWIPLEEKYFTVQNVEAFADVIVAT